MRNYSVLYKTEADQDGRLWPLGPFPDRNHALDIFNSSVAKQENIGPFTFDETSDFLPHYSAYGARPS
jgi:hypothetical protein